MYFSFINSVKISIVLSLCVLLNPIIGILVSIVLYAMHKAVRNQYLDLGMALVLVCVTGLTMIGASIVIYVLVNAVTFVFKPKNHSIEKI